MYLLLLYCFYYYRIGCPEETDLNYKIAWPFTEATTKATNSCPNGTGTYE